MRVHRVAPLLLTKRSATLQQVNLDHLRYIGSILTPVFCDTECLASLMIMRHIAEYNV